jgi:predicted membrane metal-binding protein
MVQKPDFHEDFRRDDEVRVGSERGFGIVFAVVFAVVAVYPIWNGDAIRWWALAIAIFFLAAGMFAPRLLRPFNRVWFAFGLLLHKIVNPLVMGLLFFATVTPTAIILRLFGKDPLRLRFDRDAKTYWIERRPPGPAPETMRNQF